MTAPHLLVHVKEAPSDLLEGLERESLDLDAFSEGADNVACPGMEVRIEGAQITIFMTGSLVRCELLSVVFHFHIQTDVVEGPL